MKKLSKKEMKTLTGGFIIPGGSCTKPADCGADNCDVPQIPWTPLWKGWDCRNGACIYSSSCI